MRGELVLVGKRLDLIEGASRVRHEGVVYREVWDDDGPTQVKFMAYWRDANSNPALGSLLAMLRERYPDFSAEPSAT